MHASSQLVFKRVAEDRDPDPAHAGEGHCEPCPSIKKKRRRQMGRGNPPDPPMPGMLGAEVNKLMGRLAGFTWNSNGLTSLEGSKKGMLKRQFIIELFETNDFGVITETRSNSGSCKITEQWFSKRDALCKCDHGGRKE